MKQTNNAIKFLMAQYRAIFQNAYFKGLATAAVVTMGLAAGQAQAKALDNTGFDAITDGQTITIPTDNDSISISTAATNDNNAFTIKITSAQTVDNKIEGVTASAKKASFVIAGDGSKLTVAGAAGGSGTLSIGDLKVEQGSLLLTKATNGAKVESDTITIGKKPTNEPQPTAALAATAKVSISDGSTLGKATSVYQLYEGAEITVATGGTLTGASLKAAGGKIIYKDDDDFTLKSYNENDNEKTAQKLDLDVAAGKTLSVKLAGQAATNRGVLHFGNGSVINLQTSADSGGILAITSGASNSGSVVIFDEGVTLTSKGEEANGGSVTIIGQGATSLAELQTDADVIGNFLVENDGDKAGGLLLGEHSKLTINNKKVVLGAATTENTDEALNLKIASGDGISVPTGQLTVSAATTLKADNVAIVNKLDDGTKLANKLDIVTDKLTLGSADFDASAAALGFKSASAKSELNFVSKPATTFKLQDVVTLKNVDENNNALAGTISGDVNLGTDAKDITIDGGDYTYQNGTVTLGKGDILVQANTTNKAKLAQLNFDNTNLVIERATANAGGNITVSGAAASNQKAVLDLTSANISFATGDANSAYTINSKENATVKVKSSQLDSLFFADNTKGVIFDVNGGELVIDGSRDFTASQFSSSTANSGIKFQKGTVSISETARIKGADTIDLKANAVGDSKLKAQVLDIVNATASNATTFQSGSFLVSQTLNTNSEKGFVLGANGVVQLGTLEKVTPESGEAYYVAEGSGQVNNNVEVSGASSALNVLAGTWLGKDVTVKQENGLVIGNADEAKNQAGEFITTKLSINKLVGADTTTTHNVATVNKNATLDVNSVDLSAGKVTVNGTLSLNGVEPTGEPNSLDYGLKFQDNAVTLTTGATLNLGSKVNKALGLTASGTITDFTPVDTVFLTDGVFVGESLSTVNLSLESGTSLSTAALDKINKTLFGANGTSGSIYLGQGVGISNIPYDKDASTDDTPVVNWSAVETNNGLMAVLPTFKDDKLMASKVVVDQTGPVLGHVGSIMSNNALAGNKVQISGNGSLNSADLVNGEKLFAYNKNGDVLGLEISDNVDFTLANGGKAGDIKLGKSTLVIDGGASNAKTTVSAINGQTGSLSVNGDLDVTGDLTIGKATSEAGKTLTVTQNANFKDTVNLAGNTNISGTLTAAGAFEASGNLNVSGASTFNDKATLSGAKNSLGDVTFNVAGNKITEGFTSAKEIKLANASTNLYVGTEAVTEGANITNGTSATVVTEKLSLGGGSLFVDPDYVVNSSIFVTNELTNATNVDPDNKTDAGTLSGDAIVLQNSIFAVGVDSEAKVKAALAPLFNANGALDKENNKIGAVAYVAKSITLGAGDNLIVDSARGLTAYNDAKTNNTTYQAAISNAIYLGSNSALAVDGSAFDGSKAPITLKDYSKVYVGENAKVILTGSNVVNKARGNKLFAGNNLGIAAPSNVQNPTLTVETINGWFTQDLTSLDAELTLGISRTKVDADLEVVSAPVKDTLLTVAYVQKNYDDSTAKPIPVYGELAEGIVQDTDGNFYFGKKNDTGSNKVTDKALLGRLENATVTDNGAVIYFAPENKLIDNIVYNNGSAVDAETNARLAVFGGAPQAAIEAGASTYEAISARMGVGVSGVSAAANGQGGAIWVTPVYKSADADGFNADNKSYGADVKLYGLALGADIEVAPNFKVGGMFNVGSGDADGQVLGSNVSNDFDYYGLGLYAGYSMDAFSLVADVTYTAVDNDIEGNTDLGKVNASIDSTNLSVGVTGQYKLSLAGMDVTPHAGLRYSMIDMDDYSTAYSQNDSDSINIFSIPVGVTIAKEYVTDTWTVKPSFDLTLTGNFGDDEVDATAKWYGFHDLSTNVKSEIMDNFTYGAAVGVSATSGNFGLGLGVNYTGSSNTDEFGVNANARYMF